MKNNLLLEIIIAFVLVALSIAVLNPTHLLMTDMVLMSLLAAVLAAFCLFAAFVLSERPQDEREEAHRLMAGRAGFLAGVLVLVVAITAEGHVHAVDPWLVVALVAMLLAKIAARIYAGGRK